MFKFKLLMFYNIHDMCEPQFVFKYNLKFSGSVLLLKVSGSILSGANLRGLVYLLQKKKVINHAFE